MAESKQRQAPTRLPAVNPPVLSLALIYESHDSRQQAGARSRTTEPASFAADATNSSAALWTAQLQDLVLSRYEGSQQQQQALSPTLPKLPSARSHGAPSPRKREKSSELDVAAANADVATRIACALHASIRQRHERVKEVFRRFDTDRSGEVCPRALPPPAARDRAPTRPAPRPSSSSRRARRRRAACPPGRRAACSPTTRSGLRSPSHSAAAR
jgi:hypothetical protein